MINSVNNNSNNINFKGISEKIANKMPTFTISSDKIKNGLMWVDKNIGSHDQRLILGLTALVTQPFIDLLNHKVDKDTRIVSTLRTISKIIVGTAVGVLVRWGSIKLVTKHPAFILPNVEKTSLEYKRYANAFGTLIATGVSLVSNFVVDAPLTKMLTTFFCDKYKKSQEGKK